MTADRYRPSPPAHVEAREENGRWTLVFVRNLRHPPERVWRAITDRSELAQWAPFDVDRSLDATGSATLRMADGDPPQEFASSVRRADPPRLLEYTWGEDTLRWELEPTDAGTRLTLSHSIQKSWIPKAAAGWHICLDVADHLMSGDPVGRIVGDEARKHSWADLLRAYGERTGIPPTDD